MDEDEIKTEEEIKKIVEEAYLHFANIVIAATSASGRNPRTEALISKTLTDLHTRLSNDPAALAELLTRAKLSQKPADS
jgi:hypothetical protein